MGITFFSALTSIQYHDDGVDVFFFTVKTDVFLFSPEDTTSRLGGPKNVMTAQLFNLPLTYSPAEIGLPVAIGFTLPGWLLNHIDVLANFIGRNSTPPPNGVVSCIPRSAECMDDLPTLVRCKNSHMNKGKWLGKDSRPWSSWGTLPETNIAPKNDGFQ